MGEAVREEWERFVEKHPFATAYHLWGWREVIERSGTPYGGVLCHDSGAVVWDSTLR